MYRFHRQADGSAHRVALPLWRLLHLFQMREGIAAGAPQTIGRAWTAKAFGKQVWLLCDASHNEFIGLDYGARLAYDSHVVAAICRAGGNTLLDVLEALTRFHAITGITLSSQLLFERDDCVLDSEIPYRDVHPRVERFLLQACVGFVCMTLLRLGLPTSAISCIDSTAMESTCEVPAGWEQMSVAAEHKCRIRLQAQAMQQTLARATPLQAHNLLSLLPKIYARSPLLVQVQHALATSDRLLDADQLCQRLHISNATLHRTLKGSGTHFQALLNREKFARASRWLALENATIEETAHRLGYSDASNFRRAFKKWTGTCPSTLRSK